MSEAPRCPLGFTGTPPVGHPTIAGLTAPFTSSSADSKSPAGAARQGKGASLQACAADAKSKGKWSPYTLLTLDAAFLVACVALALYWPQAQAAVKHVLASTGGEKSVTGWW